MKKALLSLFITLAFVNIPTTTHAQEYIDLSAGTFSGEWGNKDRRSVWTSENGLTITAKDTDGKEVGSMKYLNGFQLCIDYEFASYCEYTITAPEGYVLTSMKFKNGYRNYNMTIDYGWTSYNLAGGTTEQEIIFTEGNYSFQYYGDNGRHIYITELIITKVGGDNEGEGGNNNEGEGEEETSINEVKVENAQVIYDLTGRRVNEITESGIYIINGKKVIK